MSGCALVVIRPISNNTLLRFYLGVNTSTPTVTVHKSRKIQESFMFTHNPDITWAVKIYPVNRRNPRQKLIIATEYPSLIVYLGLISEVNLSSSFHLACRYIQHTN